MKKVIIYTDGACRNNQSRTNVGGYGIRMEYGGKMKEIRHACRNTTNNRMELGSVILALSKLAEECEVELYSDSEYVTKNINLGRVYEWKKNGWRNKSGETKNIDLWEQLLPLLEVHNVRFIWVKGHSVTLGNTRCDKLANEAMDMLKADSSLNTVYDETPYIKKAR